MKRSTLFSWLVAIAVMLFLAAVCKSQTVADTAKSDTLFVPFPPYREGRPLEPVGGWARFDSIVAVSENFDLKFIGTADAQTKSYKNLGKKVEYEAVLQRPLNRDYAAARGDIGKERAGRGEAGSMVVAKAKDRGIFIVRIPMQQMHVAEVAVPVALEMPGLFDGYPGDSDPLATLVQLSDGNTVLANVRYSIADTSVAVLEDGRVRYRKSGETVLLAEFGKHPYSVRQSMRADNGTNGTDGHNGTYLKKAVPIRVLAFPKTTSFLTDVGLTFGAGYSAGDFSHLPIFVVGTHWQRKVFVEASFGKSFTTDQEVFPDGIGSMRKQYKAGSLSLFPSRTFPVGLTGGYSRDENRIESFGQYAVKKEGPFLGLRLRYKPAVVELLWTPGETDQWYEKRTAWEKKSFRVNLKLTQIFGGNK